MSDQTGIQVYLKFEDEICQMGSVLDGQNLYDLIAWKDSSPGYLVLNVIPRVGEVIFTDSFWLEVTGVLHKVFPETAEPFHSHLVSIRVKQIAVGDSRTR
jgi:hypothetical protein